MKTSELLKKSASHFFFCYSIVITFFLIVKPQEQIWYDIVFSAGFSLACTLGMLLGKKFHDKK